MKHRLCPDCGVKMDHEWAWDFEGYPHEVLVWYCPECGHTHIEGCDD